LGVPPPPQVWGEVQLPQLAVREAPQLSVPLTLPQFLPRREQKVVLDSGVQPPPPPPQTESLTTTLPAELKACELVE
jgi:hypothetical protein